MTARLDLHIHSCYSIFDGMMSPRAIVKLANKLDYQAIAVTDHYTYDGAVRGSFATRRLAQGTGLTVYPGLEYHVNDGPRQGHVLVYVDHEDQVPERGLTLDELLDHCRDEGLLVIHPHPFGFAGIRSRSFMEAADYVEVNGSYGHHPVNGKLFQAAVELGISDKLVANSDAHARGQMGAAFTEVAELHTHLADTLETRIRCGLAPPKRTWGRAAKTARAILQPIGLLMNGVQRLATNRALSSVPTGSAPAEA